VFGSEESPVSEEAPQRREDERGTLIGELRSVLDAPRAGGEVSTEQVERIAQLVRSAHDAGLSPDLIAVEADMSVNEVRRFIGLPSEGRRPYDWTISFVDGAADAGR